MIIKKEWFKGPKALNFKRIFRNAWVLTSARTKKMRLFFISRKENTRTISIFSFKKREELITIPVLMVILLSYYFHICYHVSEKYFLL